MKKPNFFSVFKILFLLWIISALFSAMFGITTGSTKMTNSNANVAIIPIKGVIMVEGGSDLFGSTRVASSDAIIQKIKKAESNPKIKAIIFEINSPGGGGVASDEISQEIKKSNKTTVAVIREVGASGAYWIASATDHIFANRMSITGSIGVIGSYLEYSDLLSRFNVTYRRFVAGEHKDMGTPLKEITDEETEMLQGILDQMHIFFIEEVAQNRGLDIEYTKELATGRVFLGSEALEVDLIDELGSMEDASSYIEKVLNISVSTTKYEEKKSLSDLLSQFTASFPTTKFIYPTNQLNIRT